MDSTDSYGRSNFQVDPLHDDEIAPPSEQETFSAVEVQDRSPDPQETGSLQVVLRLLPGMRVRLTVETLQEGDSSGAGARTVILGPPASAVGEPVIASFPLPVPKGAAKSGVLRGARAASEALQRSGSLSLPAVLFGLALVVYVATRFIGLVQFPIYFFTDEAVHTVLGADLLRDGFRNYAGEFLPAFFENGGKYRLGVTVYTHAITYFLFGKSVFVARATSALVSTGAAIAVALAARRVFRLSYWWSGALFLSITPAWFLHSRTAFEYTTGCAFYALFLLFYLLYRVENPRYLVPAMAFGGLAFYTYSPLQLVVLASGALFLLFDLRYHWRQRQTAFWGLLVLLLLALPYARFLLAHAGENTRSLRALGSYWTQPLPVIERLRLFSAAYLEGLNPWFWYNRAPQTLPRHLMKGYGHMLPLTFPLLLAGLGLAVRSAFSGSTERQPAAHRTILLALLAAPTGSALVEPGVTRLLVLAIPASLLVVLGTDACLRALERSTRRFSLPAGATRGVLSVGLFVLLSGANIAMLRDALINGPTWFTDYGLGGMQYGAAQVFEAVRERLVRDPDTEIVLSPTWANGTDVLARFMLSDPLPVQLGSIDGYLNHQLPVTENTLFIMTPEEYEKTIASEKFTGVRVERILPYPNGQPGFYFLRLRYVDGVEAIFAREAEERRALLEEEVPWQGQTLTVRHSMLDIGSIDKILDGDPLTVARTFEANPFQIEIAFHRPLLMGGYTLVIGSAEVEVISRLYDRSGAQVTEYRTRVRGSVDQPLATVPFESPVEVGRIGIMVQDLEQQEPGHVHVWEIEFQGADFSPAGPH